MGDEYIQFVIAAAQISPVYLDREATVEKACHYVEDASKKGAKFLAFPEGFIPGFPQWIYWESPMFGRDMELYTRLFANAVEIPSKSTDILCETARQTNCNIIVGINERVPGTKGTLYNTQLFIGSDGSIMGKHRKIVPTYAERIVHGYGDGSTLDVFPTKYGKVGGLICGENNNSLARFALLAKGEDIHVASWPGPQGKSYQNVFDSIIFTVRETAFEGKLYVISSTMFYSREIVEELCKTDLLKREIEGPMGGSTCIVDPQGNILSMSSNNNEEIVYAQADTKTMVEAKLLHDLTGHYNRFDIFSFKVNEKELSPLSATKEEGARAVSFQKKSEKVNVVENV